MKWSKKKLFQIKFQSTFVSYAFSFYAQFKFLQFCVPGYHVREVDGTQNGRRPQDDLLEKCRQQNLL